MYKLSYIHRKINALSRINNDHGVCGFVSCLQAIYDETEDSHKSTFLETFTDKANFAGLIGSFLKTCQKKRPDLIGDINAFTRMFGEEYTYFSCQMLIWEIDRKKEIMNGALDVAMPPSAVLYFLHELAFRQNAQFVDTQHPLQRCIVGLADGSIDADTHNGLAHWAYYRGGTLFSWGHAFPGGTLEDALEALNEHIRRNQPEGVEAATYDICMKLKL